MTTLTLEVRNKCEAGIAYSLLPSWTLKDSEMQFTEKFKLLEYPLKGALKTRQNRYSF